MSFIKKTYNNLAINATNRSLFICIYHCYSLILSINKRSFFDRFQHDIKGEKIHQLLRMENYMIGFYLEKLYYIPHFEPVIKEIIKRDISYVIIIPKNRGRDELNQREESIKYCQERDSRIALMKKTGNVILWFSGMPHVIFLPYLKNQPSSCMARGVEKRSITHRI